jgi:hypothetical protein
MEMEMTITTQQYNTVINGLRQQLELLRAEGSEYRQAAEAAEASQSVTDIANVAKELSGERDNFRADVIAAVNITMGLQGVEAKTEEGQLLFDTVTGLGEALADANDTINELSDLVDGIDAVFAPGSQAEKIAKCICKLRVDNLNLRKKKKK